MQLHEKIGFALTHCGLPPLASPEDARYLGAGAWNEAYLITLKDGQRLVIRFPKEIAYGVANPYNEKAWRGDYEAAGYYYKQANRVSPGICPDVYHCYVTPELTFTIETYLGKTLKLAETDETAALDYGRQMGEFFRAMDSVKSELNGFGYLVWNDRLEGGNQGDALDNLRDEKAEFLEELELLLGSNWSFDRETVKSKLHDTLDQRAPETHPIALTNQDTSTENNIIHNGRLSLIDPLPIIYSGYVFAGNAVNNKKLLMPAYHNTPRYGKNQYDTHKHLLVAMGEGFLQGYAQGQRDVSEAVVREQFLQVFSATINHLRVLGQEEIPVRTRMRMGERDAIEARLALLLQELTSFSF